MGDGTTELTSDRVFELISNTRRRYILSRLDRSDGPLVLSELAKELAAWENDTTVDELSTQARKRVYVSLYQTHVPQLDEAGLIEYDADEGTVSRPDDAAPLEQHLGSSTEQPRWYLYYIALATANVALTAGAISGLIALSQTVAGVIFTGSFLVVATLHALYRKVWSDTKRPSLVNA